MSDQLRDIQRLGQSELAAAVDWFRSTLITSPEHEHVTDLEARLNAARDEWRRTRATLLALRDRHHPIEVRNPYQPDRDVREKRCTVCTHGLFPCATRRALDQLLERRAG